MTPVHRSRLRALLPALLGAAFLGGPHLRGCAPKGDGHVDGDVTVRSEQRNRWVLYDFETESVLTDDAGDVLVVDDPATVTGWDLAFSRWVVATPSGTTQTDGSASRGALLAVEGATDAWADFDDFTGRCSDFVAAGSSGNDGTIGCGGGAPTVDEGYVADVVRDPDGAGPVAEASYNPSLTSWFEYVFAGHEVVPYGNVYVLETRGGDCLKLQLTDYYDEDGEGGAISFRWAWLPE